MIEERPSIKIRLATESDASLIAALLHKSFVEFRSDYTDDAFAATTSTSDQVKRRISEGPVWVAWQGDVMVGTISAVARGEELYIRGMAVLPSARGLRLGELLLKEAENFAASRNSKRIVLSTTPFLLRAIRLYEHTGFRRTSEGPHDLFGTPLFTMVKDLPPR